METTDFELDEYLERLDYAGPVRPTQDRLEALHNAQYFKIAFENFDIHLGRGVSLAPADLVDKLVRKMRGGYGNYFSSTHPDSLFTAFRVAAIPTPVVPPHWST